MFVSRAAQTGTATLGGALTKQSHAGLLARRRVVYEDGFRGHKLIGTAIVRFLAVCAARDGSKH